MLLRTLNKRILPGLLSLFVFAACSEKESKQERFGEVDTGNCQVSPYDGNSAYGKVQSLDVQDSGYFSKNMAVGHLETLFPVSGEATWNYIINLGVPLFKVQENPKAQCRYFAQLQSAQGAELENWQSKNTSSGDGSGSLLGLFTSTISKNLQTGQVRLQKFAITVREDSQRWTLLHEFAHYLYAQARVLQLFLPFNDEINQEIRKIRDRIKSTRSRLADQPTETDGVQLMKNWAQLFEQSLELDRRGPLEEFAIESLLFEEYLNDKISYINQQFDLRNARAYMKQNKKMIIPLYENMVEQIIKDKNKYFADDWNQAEVEFNQVVARIESIIEFSEIKMNRADKFTDELQESLNTDDVDSDSSNIVTHHFEINDYITKEEIIAEILE